MNNEMNWSFGGGGSRGGWTSYSGIIVVSSTDAYWTPTGITYTERETRTCQYCRSKFIEDSRGNCKACGAPNGSG